MNLQDSLTCPICFGQYDGEEHAPRLLPCGGGHSICTACILHLLFSSDAALHCPFDRSLIRLKERNLSDFPQNLALKYFLVENDPSTFCQVHGNKKLDIVCLQCRCRICYICEKRQHHDHKTELLDDVTPKIREKTSEFKKYISRIEDARTKRKTLIEKKEAKLFEAIDKKFEADIAKLLEKRDAFKETVHKDLERLKEEILVQENSESGEVVKWIESVKAEINTEEVVVAKEVDEKLLYVLIDKEHILNNNEVDKWLQLKQEQSELLMCTLDNFDESCREKLKDYNKNLLK